MTLENQNAYAKRHGWNRSTVTRFRDQGRLVMVDGLVDVEASDARLQETADPAKTAVTARHAAERAQGIGQGGQDPENATKGHGAGEIGESYQKARAIKEKYLALQAKADYERSIGLLLPRAEVEQSLEDVVAFARSSLENLPHRVAGKLVGKDYDSIRATLKNDIVELMTEMHTDAKRQLATLTTEAK